MFIDDLLFVREMLPGAAATDAKKRTRRIVDAMTIFHRKERRDLTAAVRLFLDRDHTGAHSAEADVIATAEVLDAQLERYSDLPRAVEDLDRWIRRVSPGARTGR